MRWVRMVASIPSRQGRDRHPVDLSRAAARADAAPGMPQGKVSAVTARRLRRRMREDKRAERCEKLEAVKWEAAARAGVKRVEEILVVDGLEVGPRQKNVSVCLVSRDRPVDGAVHACYYEMERSV